MAERASGSQNGSSVNSDTPIMLPIVFREGLPRRANQSQVKRLFFSEIRVSVLQQLSTVFQPAVSALAGSVVPPPAEMQSPVMKLHYARWSRIQARARQGVDRVCQICAQLVSDLTGCVTRCRSAASVRDGQRCDQLVAVDAGEASRVPVEGAPGLFQHVSLWCGALSVAYLERRGRGWRSAGFERAQRGPDWIGEIRNTFRQVGSNPGGIF